MCVYLRAKFQVSSIIQRVCLSSKEGNFTPPPLSQNAPLKSSPRLGLSILDASKPIKEKFVDAKSSFKSKHKNIREIRKENRDEDKMFKGLTFSFDSEKDNIEPKKTVSSFTNKYI